MNKIKTLCALSLILALSACSSSGGGGGGATFNALKFLSDASGASFNSIGDATNGDSIDDSTLVRNIMVAFDDVEKAIDDGSLTALTTETVPAGGEATLNGYVSIPGKVTEMATDVAIVGHLTITVDFGAADTVTATATGFTEFDITDPDGPVATGGILAGTLEGRGTITGTTITSPLNGPFSGGSKGVLEVRSTLTGDVYEEGDTLITYGTVEGTIAPITAPSMTDTFTDGEFAASGDRPSE